MSDFNWKGLVGTVAPTLATALGGPFAGMAVKAISSAVLGNEGGSEGDIALALTGASPDTMLALKEADNSFALRMKELDVDAVVIGAGNGGHAMAAHKTLDGFEVSLFELPRFADRIALTAEDSKAYFPGKAGLTVSGYPTRSEMQTLGSVPLHTLEADVDYGFAPSFTTYGVIGVKVWIYRGMFGDEPTEENNVAAATMA